MRIACLVSFIIAVVAIFTLQYVTAVGMLRDTVWYVVVHYIPVVICHLQLPKFLVDELALDREHTLLLIQVIHRRNSPSDVLCQVITLLTSGFLSYTDTLVCFLR